MAEEVLIVGCGVFGLSTAVEMAKRGYKVTALDAYPVPSPWSASADYNKIVRTEYDNMFYTELALEALESWRTDPDLSKVYSECGRITITPKHHSGRIEFEKRSIENLKSLSRASDIKHYANVGDFARDFKQFGNNGFSEDTKITFNPECGLGHAAKSLLIMKQRAEILGVHFKFGKGYETVNVVQKNERNYVLTKNGSMFTADKILICAGAGTARIVNLHNQTNATGLFVGHIKLTEDEYEKYKDIPIVFSAEDGYYFPPDPDTRIIKIAAAVDESCNVVTDQFKNHISLPRYKTHYPYDTIPKTSARDITAFLEKTLPDLAYHKIINPKICWISDTVDSNFLIDKIPDYSNVFVATGDSGHAYKFLPNIGKYISDRLEDKLDLVSTERWSWKENNRPKSLDWRVKRKKIDLARSNCDFVIETDASKL
ncbi:uncharacterized protein PRCAT00002105001 [Priceomyces carsonii]|uniref:uncharacterized protein n=1 Tax=Priceomyces carsonii TaxID=28549 RepID=UPI002EDB6D9A|nr:unnamed protein product [Priceomyces carsonii]